MCLARSQGGIYKGDDLGQLISESAIINTSLQESQTTHRRYNNTLLLYSEVPLKKSPSMRSEPHAIEFSIMQASHERDIFY